MERHKCRLCLKSFANGRALGGHMRSHMLNLPVPPKFPEESPVQLSEEAESASSSSSSEEDEEEEGGGGGGEEEKGQFYGLRENPKRSIRLVDPEFSLAVDAGSVVLQDRESETESSKNPTRRRSKRTWKLDHEYHHQQQSQEHDNTKKLKFNQLSRAESWAAEPEPVSSISDATNEEDVAFCLMMLSRDKWKKNEQQQPPEQETEQEQQEETEETDESEDSKLYKNNRSRGKYKCETCNRVFKSYQALGGHRASHKKIKLINSSSAREPEVEPENVATSLVADKKIHECPVCFRVFSSGQALGGHKRSHVTGLVATPAKGTTTSTKFGENSFIDLNLPAPMEDNDYSQIELSAVSYAEFVNHHIRR